MARYARGMRAWGICARSGRKMLLKDMVFDGQYPNLRVDPEWYEPKHPQEMLLPLEDPIALYRPSPETIAPPTAPIVTLFVAGINEIDVTWTPAESGITDMEEYILTKSVNGAAYQPLATCVLQKDFLDGIIGITNATFPVQPEYPGNPHVRVPPDQPATYRDLGVVFGSTYCYMVEAVPQGNNQSVAQGPPITSAPVCVTVTFQPAVLIGAYDFTNNVVNLSWSLPSTWQAVVLNFQVWKSINGAAFTLLTTVGPGVHILQDASANTFTNVYQYYVVAMYAGGNALPSNTVSAPTVVTTVYTQTTSWPKPAGLQWATITGIGGGGGGAAGTVTAGNGMPGTGGGGGGGYAQVTYAASALLSNESIVVGLGGAGGFGPLHTDSQGQFGPPGFNGGNTSFGSHLLAGGGGGNSGSNPQPGGGTSVTGGINVIQETGGAGGHNASGDGTGGANPGASTVRSGAGGAGGMGMSFLASTFPDTFPMIGGSVTNGGAGGAGVTFVDVSSGNATGFTASDGAPSPNPVNGAGGGGGGGGVVVNRGPDNNTHLLGGGGGKGAFPGGGGGAGGMSNNFQQAGAPGTGCTTQGGPGGKGGDGILIITTYS